MELITSGLVLMPQKLTSQAIYNLTFQNINEISNKLFSIQVISVGSGESDSLFKSSHGGNVQAFEVSDGVGSATAIIQKEVLDELDMLGTTIVRNTVIVIRGKIFR